MANLNLLLQTHVWPLQFRQPTEVHCLDWIQSLKLIKMALKTLGGKKKVHNNLSRTLSIDFPVLTTI